MKYFFLFVTVIILFNCKPEKEEPKPLTAPVLTTMEAGDITAISALSGGAISSDGGSPVTARGIVWSISHNPTLADSISEEGTGIGSFTSDLTPLKYSTTYYVRAYATNSIGTTYGNEVTFNTKAAVPSDGLVGWWPFNGNANDESGNGNDGVVNGATLSNDRFNNSDLAYYFDGSRALISTSNSSFNFSQDFSISIWIQANTTNHGVLINSSPHTIFGLASNPYWGDGPGYLGILYGTGGLFGWINNGGNNFLLPSNTLNVWYNLIITKSEFTWSVYINATLLGDFITLQQPSSQLAQLIFGHCDPTACAEVFDGILDDIAIYNRALTAEEIQKIYNGTGF